MRTVSRRVRHVRQLTVPVVLGFHQRPSVQFAGFQFNLIIITRRRRRRRKKVVSVQFYAGRIPLKNTLSEEEEDTEKKTVSPTSKRDRLLPLPSLFLSFLRVSFRENKKKNKNKKKKKSDDDERKFRRDPSLFYTNE